MLEIQNLLNIGECKDLVAFADKALQAVQSAPADESQRSSKSIEPYHSARAIHADLTDAITTRLKAKLRGYNEVYGPAWDNLVWVHSLWNWTRYHPGQYIKCHRDGTREGGSSRSFATILIYLTANFEGGETCCDFHTVCPKAGTAVLLEQDLPHWSNPIIHGVKYIARSDLMIEIPAPQKSIKEELVVEFDEDSENDGAKDL